MSDFKKDNNLMSGKGEWDESKHPRDEDGKFISISEFRYLEDKTKNGSGHPSHLYAKDKDDNVKYHQLTHSEEIKEKGTKKRIKTKKLNKNPNPKDPRSAYFITESKNGKLNEFGKKKKNWVLSAEDDKILKQFRDPPFDE